MACLVGLYFQVDAMYRGVLLEKGLVRQTEGGGFAIGDGPNHVDHGAVGGDVAFFLRSYFIPILNDDHDSVFKRHPQEVVLRTFLADLDFNPAEYLDVLGLFGLVGIVGQLAALHYFHVSFVLLDVVGSKDRILDPYAAWDEFLW